MAAKHPGANEGVREEENRPGVALHAVCERLRCQKKVCTQWAATSDERGAAVDKFPARARPRA